MLVDIKQIEILPSRQRREFSQESISELADSIGKLGLLHPVVTRKRNGKIYLVAGERRLRALEHLWITGGNSGHPEGLVPCTDLGDMDPIDAFEAELEENIRRDDLTWQEQATATSQLYELRRLQAERKGTAMPTSASMGEETGRRAAAVREDVLVAKHLNDPDISKATTVTEALKILKRKEQAAKSAELGELTGRTFSSKDHTLMKGNCITLMPGLKEGSFDCILTDPPYGINAQDFNDSGGKAVGGGHSYDDSYNTWFPLMRDFSHISFKLCKPAAHAYVFCDIDNFSQLRDLMRDAGWSPFRTPLIWHNPSSQRAPWPQTGPHRKWQMFLYAVKGDRPALSLKPDLVTYASDDNLGWSAQKPVDLYRDLLLRTCHPGDACLDPFAGSGTIFPAAHSLKIRATGIEMDDVAYGIAVMRLGELK